MSSGLRNVLTFGLALMLMFAATNSHALKADHGSATKHSDSKAGLSMEEVASKLHRRGCRVLKAKRRKMANGETGYVIKCLMPGGKMRTMVLNPMGEVVQ